MRYVSFIHRDRDSATVSASPTFRVASPLATPSMTPSTTGVEALAFHVEGLSDDGEPVPPPRTIEAIKADPELAAWRRGADIVLVPLLLDRGSSKRVNISLDRGLLEAIDDEASRRRMTRSAFLSNAARHELETT